MRTAALIPIKTHSQRLPGKNTRPFFDGTPLMAFIQRACLDAALVDETYVYCSDESIRDYVLPGVRFLRRPEFLDADTVNANDIIREFMKAVDAEIYVNAHATSPFARPATIDACVERVASGEYDSAFCAESLKTFLWMEGRPLNFDPAHFPRTQDLPIIYAETSIAYVFRRETFLTHNRRVGVRPFVQEVGRIEAMDIDYPEDFEVAEAIYRGLLKGRERT